MKNPDRRAEHHIVIPGLFAPIFRTAQGKNRAIAAKKTTRSPAFGNRFARAVTAIIDCPSRRGDGRRRLIPHRATSNCRRNRAPGELHALWKLGIRALPYPYSVFTGNPESETTDPPMPKLLGPPAYMRNVVIDGDNKPPLKPNIFDICVVANIATYEPL